jgi:CubicO group peptidase (beta-lactamase class C family)
LRPLRGSSLKVPVHGLVEPGFGAVADAFAGNFAEHGDVGAACSVHVDGRPVVDVWGGTADVASGRPWTADTIVVMYSTTKGVTSCCAHLLAQRGGLDFDAPVVTWWPEFGARGKEGILVRWLLAHQAGLPYVDATLTLDEVLAWDPVVRALEQQAPLWEPGTGHGYHAMTFGWLVGELVRRASGRSIGRYLREEIAEPLGLDLWLGLPSEHEHRVAPLAGSASPRKAAAADPRLAELVAQFTGPDTMLGKALSAPSGVLRGRDVWNSRAVHAAELPAGNAISDARSLSRLFAATIGAVEGSGRLLSEAQVDRARTRQTTGADLALHIETTFGLGFMVSSKFARYGGAGSFGHTGNGGSVAFADPENGIAFAYLTNGLQSGLTGDKRSRRLVGATYEAAGAPAAYV